MWWDECPGCHKSNDSRCTGFWRQWEAFDCPDLDSIHNDGERHLPYLLLFPNSTRNKLAAWAGNQQPDGMLAEQILQTAPDTPAGRVMADATSMFIVYILELLRWAGDTTSLGLYYPTVRRAAEWQMNVSASLGVPTHLETTYDILQFPQHQLSTYASVFHITAMRAAAALATAAGEPADAATFGAAADRAAASLDALQWVPGNGTAAASFTETPHTYCVDDFVYAGSGLTPAECVGKCGGSCLEVFLSTDGAGDCYLCPAAPTHGNTSSYTLYARSGAVGGAWAAASDGCVEKQGCANQTGVFADALYGQVLAYSAGLGTVVSSPSKIASHLAAVLRANCYHVDGGDPDIQVGGHLSPGCDNAGVAILTGRARGATDWMSWEGAAPNQATLALRSGAQPPAEALENFRKSATSWSERINDQWNTAGIKDTDGYPTVTSHYGFHMVSWHVPLALSGQLADLSAKGNRSLTFAPAVDPPYSLPLMLPGVLGVLASAAEGEYRVSLTVGAVELDLLSVDGHPAPGGAVSLVAGGPAVAWQAV
eukprot:m.310465 g.310465  ORF g.310465 m.310465 type:complete len:540 (-) comp16380_c0_seq1:162-1781(-)